MFGKIEVYRTKQQLIRGAAEVFTQTVNSAVAQKGVCTIALAGGTTPRDVYGMLASDPFKDRVAWKHIHFFWGDERAVSPQHPDSNYGMVYRHLLAKVPVPASHIHRIHGELPPQMAAEQYEDALANVFADQEMCFDLVLLGIGQDGHTASIFPNTQAVNDLAKKVTAVYVPGLQCWRISLTLPLLNMAKKIVSLASGEKKAEILRKLHRLSSPDASLPASLIQPANGELLWMLDSHAALFLASQATIA
ncbi:MAG: 6-phosphogluconolactonase [bacterium]